MARTERIAASVEVSLVMLEQAWRPLDSIESRLRAKAVRVARAWGLKPESLKLDEFQVLIRPERGSDKRFCLATYKIDVPDDFVIPERGEQWRVDVHPFWLQTEGARSQSRPSTTSSTGAAGTARPRRTGSECRARPSTGGALE